MGKGGKSAERIVVVTDQFLIKIDTKKNKVMDKEPLSVITGLSILDYDSSKIGKCFFSCEVLILLQLYSIAPHEMTL